MSNKKIKGCGFHHVSMRVKDLEKSRKFYSEGLGFVERFSWGQEPKKTVLLDTGDGHSRYCGGGEVVFNLQRTSRTHLSAPWFWVLVERPWLAYLSVWRA